VAQFLAGRHLSSHCGHKVALLLTPTRTMAAMIKLQGSPHSILCSKSHNKPELTDYLKG
jgi:hypothetical protein